MAKKASIGPPGPDTPVYVISVAAELTGLHPQTLRTYDRLGLVIPDRAGGGGRRYTMRDIELLRHVARLTAEGLGLEGVRRVRCARRWRRCGTSWPRRTPPWRRRRTFPSARRRHIRSHSGGVAPPDRGPRMVT